MNLNEKYYLEFILFITFFFSTLELRKVRMTEDDKNLNEKETYIKPPSFSKVSGFYPDNFKLKLLSEGNNTIYYTLDSSDPRTSSTSQEFKNYILIYDRSLEPNVYSAIGVNMSSPVSIATSSNYKIPNYPVDKAMIVRAVAKNSKGEFSDIITKTYFVTNEDLYKYQDLTIVSLVTNPENLFDPDIGIYVGGTMSMEENKDEGEGGWGRWMRRKCNYLMKGKEWEREAFITILEKGEINIQQKVGIRIKGAFTRNNPGKSFNIYARKDYGKSTIETNLLKDNFDINGNLITSYKSLSLRNIYEEGRLRDKFGRDLFYKRNGLTSINMINSILFLNGEYWGFYLIQEKIDKNFISDNYLVPDNNVVLAKANELEDGPKEEYDDFNYFCGNYSQKDVSNENIYSEINDYIDLDSLIELFATEIYISNLDWPGNNDGEWKYTGKPIEGNKYTDGKWRFIIYDLDYTMGAFFFTGGSYDINNFQLIENNRRKRLGPINIFLSLIKNNYDFQYKFVNTICDYVNGIYTSEIINELIEKYEEEYIDMIANSQLRWSGINFYSTFEGYAQYKTVYLKALDSIKEFFEQRPKYIFQYMKDYLELKGNEIELTIEIEGRGQIQVNSIFPKFINNKWVGKYFSRVPIIIKAIPENGYTFKEWTGYIKSKKQNDEVTLLDSQKIIAVFE